MLVLYIHHSRCGQIENLTPSLLSFCFWKKLHTKLGVLLLLAYIYKSLDHRNTPMDQQQTDFTESIDLSVAHDKHQSWFYLLLQIESDTRFYKDYISKSGFLHILQKMQHSRMRSVFKCWVQRCIYFWHSPGHWEDSSFNIGDPQAYQMFLIQH